MVRRLKMNHEQSHPMSLHKVTQQKEKALQKQIEWQQLVMAIAVRIRQSLNLDTVLNTTVCEVRQFLATERVFMYQFHPDFSGTVVVESVASGWKSILHAQVQDTYFVETKGEEYIHGRIQVVEDIYSAGLSECHCDLLTQFQVRANLVVPILQQEQLWGLLVARALASNKMSQRALLICQRSGLFVVYWWLILFFGSPQHIKGSKSTCKSHPRVQRDGLKSWQQRSLYCDSRAILSFNCGKIKVST